MLKYIIKNDEGQFFEADFAGWSWQEDERLARKFSTREEAESCSNWLNNLNEPNSIEELK